MDRELPLGALAPDAARTLLSRLLGTDWSDVSTTSLDTLLSPLGGLPLAIELAAAQVHVAGWSAGEGSQPILQLGDLIAGAASLLDQGATRALVALATFAGPVAPDRCVEVLDAPAAEVEEALARLHSHSLAVLGADGRFDLLQPIRGYARNMNEHSAWRPALLARHALLAIERAENLLEERRRTGGDGAVAELGALVPELELGLTRFLATDAALAGRLALGLHEIRLVRGPIQMAIEAAEVALAVGGPALAVAANEALARSLVQRGDLVRAGPLLDVLLKDDEVPMRLRARLRRSAGLVRRGLGDPVGAERLWRDALAQAGGDGVEEAFSACLVAVATMSRGAFDEAELLLERALEVAERDGGPAVVGFVLTAVGELSLRRGRIRDAELAYRRAEELASAAGDRQAETLAVAHLSRVPLPVGELRAVLERAIPLARRVGDQQYVAVAQSRLAVIAAAIHGVVPHPDPELQLLSALGADSARAIAELNLALGHAITGAPAAAAALLSSAIARAPMLEGVAQSVAMHLAMLRGDYSEALDHHAAAVAALGSSSQHVSGELVEAELALIRAAQRDLRPDEALALATDCLARLRAKPRSDVGDIRILELLLGVSHPSMRREVRGTPG